MSENKQITSRTEGVEIRAQSNAHNQGRLSRLPAAAPTTTPAGGGSSGSGAGTVAPPATSPAGSGSSAD